MWQTWAAAVIVVTTLAVMTTGKVRPVIALGCALVTAGALRLATPAELYSGLSNGGVITVGAMLVIARGIVQTGVVARVTRRLLLHTQTAAEALRRLALPVGAASGLMNTTPIVAMLIPATKSLEQTRAIPAREVMLPIAHLTTLTGSITLIGTSSNLLIAGLAGPSGVEMQMLSFARIALPVAVVGFAFLYLVGPRLLRKEQGSVDVTLDWRVEIPVGESAVGRGRTGAQLSLAKTRDFELIGIRRPGEEDYLPPDTPITGGDRLVFQSSGAGVRSLWGIPVLGLLPRRLYAVTIAPGVQSGWLDDFNDRDDGTMSVVAAQTQTSLRRTPMMPGALCYVSATSLDVVRSHPAVALWQDAGSRAPQPGRTGTALTILVAVVALASFGIVPIEIGSVGGALLMVVTRVLTANMAARALDWNVLFVLAGSVGLGAIVVGSGLADLLAEAIATLTAGNAVLVVVVLAVATTIITNLVTNAAAASILTPAAIGLAVETGLDPVTVLAMFGTCISFTFITVFSHQTNLMVVGPIGYSARAFLRLGVPLLAVCLVVACGSAVLLS